MNTDIFNKGKVLNSSVPQTSFYLNLIYRIEYDTVLYIKCMVNLTFMLVMFQLFCKFPSVRKCYQSTPQRTVCGFKLW